MHQCIRESWDRVNKQVSVTFRVEENEHNLSYQYLNHKDGFGGDGIRISYRVLLSCGSKQ